MNTTATQGMTVTEVLTDLRAELTRAVKASADEDLRFRIDSVDVELSVGTSRTTSGKAGVKVFVVEAGADAALTRASAHRLRLTLTPLFDAIDEGPTVYVSGRARREE